MISEVIIPVMDQTGGEFRLAKWLKHEGDSILAGEALCEVETNKANVELSADTAGVLRKVLVAEGATVPSLTVIALIGAAGEVLPEIDPYYRVPQHRPSTASTPSTSNTPRNPANASQRVALSASPRAKRLAAEHGLDWTTLAGTGPDGRIIEEDVRKALDNR